MINIIGVYGYPHVPYGLLRSGSIIRKYNSEPTVIVVVIISIIPVYKTTCSNVEDNIKINYFPVLPNPPAPLAESDKLSLMSNRIDEPSIATI